MDLFFFCRIYVEQLTTVLVVCLLSALDWEEPALSFVVDTQWDGLKCINVTQFLFYYLSICDCPTCSHFQQQFVKAKEV